VQDQRHLPKTQDSHTSGNRTTLLWHILLWLSAACLIFDRAGNLPQLHLDESINSLPQGIYLLEGIHINDISFSMPMVPFLSAIIYDLPKWLEQFAWLIFYLFMLLLCFCAGSLLRSRISGVLAIAFMAYAFKAGPADSTFGPFGGMVYAASCGVALLALLLRAGKPRTWTGELGTAAALGLSFMIKSPLALLPPLLAAYEILSGKLRDKETSAGKLAVLLIGPYLLLTPWVYMNYSLDRVWLLFEGGRADENLITGALGIVFTVEGAYSLVDLPRNANFKLWALKTVLTHPLTYLESVLKRVYWLFAWYPLAISGLLAALLRFRHEERFHMLGLFVFYQAGILCLLSIQPPYFGQLWVPALAACAALATPASKEKNLALARLVFISALVFQFACYLLLAAFLAAYPFRIQHESKFFRSDDVMPSSNPILLVRAADEALYNGETERAYILSRSALLQRFSIHTVASFLRTLSSRDIDIEPPIRNKIIMRLERNNRLRLGTLRLINAIQKGSDEQVRNALTQLRADWKTLHLTFVQPTSEREKALYNTQQARDNSFDNDFVPLLLERLSPDQRNEFANRLLRLGLESNRLRIMELEALSTNPAKRKQLIKAIAVLAQKLKNLETQLALLRLCVDNNLFLEAASHAEFFLKKTESFRIRFYMADALLRSDQLEKGYAQLQHIGNMNLDMAERRWLNDLHENYDSRANDVVQLIHDKKYAAAKQLAKRLLRIREDAALRLSFSRTFYDTGQYETAEKLLAKLSPADLPEQEQDQYNELNYLLTGARLLPLAKAENFAKLAQEAKVILKKEPANPTAQLYLAEALLHQGFPNQAHTLLQQLSKQALLPAQWKHIAKLENWSRQDRQQKHLEEKFKDLAKWEETKRNQNTLKDCDNSLANKNYQKLKAAAEALIKTDEYKVSGHLYMATALLENHKPVEALTYVNAVRGMPLSKTEKQWADSITKKIAETISTDQMLRQSAREQELSQNANNPSKLLPLARAFVRDYPQNITGKLYFSAALISTGNLNEAQKLLEELRALKLNAGDSTWLLSLEGYLGREQDKCSLKNLRTCAGMRSKTAR